MLGSLVFFNCSTLVLSNIDVNDNNNDATAEIVAHLRIVQSTTQPPSTPPPPTLDTSEVARHQRETLALGKLPFQRSRVMVVGQGRVGKTTLLRRLLGKSFDPNEKSTVGAVTQDIDTTMGAKSVREQEGVDILQAEIADGWNTLLEDADADEEHVRAMRQEVVRRAKESKMKEEEEAARRQAERDNEKERGDMRTPEEVGEVIKWNGKNKKGVKCIVLNLCECAKSANEFINGAEYVIGWETERTLTGVNWD
ncbi:hypothetical protein TL16_g04169 [Triparma laevis f. inornata]|uniref:G domain-containing protein n=1 Tax=Triparma laevis f. inornata TaxID=1714386 RepID=A0A9W7A3T6_9STRA|nr:hypothetical protein TL16_g04169 [Triparma laevis f. inornata]